jgi:hypothetical protein
MLNTDNIKETFELHISLLSFQPIPNISCISNNMQQLNSIPVEPGSLGSD